MAVVSLVVAAAAKFLPQILRSIAGLEVDYGSAFVALSAGALVGVALKALLVPLLHRNPALALGGSLLALLPSLAATYVSYLLLTQVAVQAPTTTAQPVPTFDEVEAPVDASYSELLVQARTAVTSTCNRLAYCRVDEVHARAAESLIDLQRATDRLRLSTPAENHEAHEALIAALRELQDDVADLARRGGAPGGIVHCPSLERVERAFEALGIGR